MLRQIEARFEFTLDKAMILPDTKRKTLHTIIILECKMKLSVHFIKATVI